MSQKSEEKAKAGAAGLAPPVLATHNAGVGLLHEGMREIAVVPRC